MGICPGPNSLYKRKSYQEIFFKYSSVLKKFLLPRKTFRRLQITKFWNQLATPNGDTPPERKVELKLGFAWGKFYFSPVSPCQPTQQKNQIALKQQKSQLHARNCVAGTLIKGVKLFYQKLSDIRKYNMVVLQEEIPSRDIYLACRKLARGCSSVRYTRV